jgi:hypothetical protein
MLFGGNRGNAGQRLSPVSGCRVRVFAPEANFAAPAIKPAAREASFAALTGRAAKSR